jgi:hypothetical protein
MADITSSDKTEMLCYAFEGLTDRVSRVELDMRELVEAQRAWMAKLQRDKALEEDLKPAGSAFSGSLHGTDALVYKHYPGLLQEGEQVVVLEWSCKKEPCAALVASLEQELLSIWGEDRLRDVQARMALAPQSCDKRVKCEDVGVQSSYGTVGDHVLHICRVQDIPHLLVRPDPPQGRKRRAVVEVTPDMRICDLVETMRLARHGLQPLRPRDTVRIYAEFMDEDVVAFVCATVGWSFEAAEEAWLHVEPTIQKERVLDRRGDANSAFSEECLGVWLNYMNL